MEYIISLKLIDGDKNAEAKVGIAFPVGAYFTTHATVANALTALIPILMGEVVQRIEPAIAPEKIVGEVHNV